ncbi:MAG TPA: acetyl-CoA carboxylase biotin carboxyl carrier protein subunit [Coprothermobacter sp.]|jgi:biotin carboxyl carrier protein|nr:acetyl-CoA carboxylase biotin carboxyl carrier protein subunit [Coprothermobacter sp.]
MGKVFQYVVRVNGKEYNVEIESENEEIFLKSVTRAASSATQTLGEESTQKVEPALTVGTSVPTTSSVSQKPAAPSKTGGTVVEAPLPGKILRINVSTGSQVKRGDLLLILEAMKMENEILAPVDGVVDSVLVSPNQTVNTHDPLVVLK